MAKKGLELLVDGFKNLFDGVAGFFGGAMHATGSTARGTGYGLKETGKGIEPGLEEVGKGAAYVAHGTGHLAKGAGKLFGRLERKLVGSENFIEVPQGDFKRLVELEPKDQVRELMAYEAEREPYVLIPRDALINAMKHVKSYQSGRGHKGYHSPLEEAASRYAAVIAIGLALALFIPVTITGASIMSQPGSSGIFGAFFVVLVLLGIFALVRMKK